MFYGIPFLLLFLLLLLSYLPLNDTRKQVD